MRKMFSFLYLVNIISGFFLLYNYLYVYETIHSYRELIMVVSFIFYLAATILYFRKTMEIEKVDIAITAVLIATCLTVFIFSLIYQMNVTGVFSMVYLNMMLLIPHILYIVYNIIRCYKKV